jgi:hypothetical protein
MRVLVYQDGRRILQVPGEKITLKPGKNTLGFLVEARTGTVGWTWGKVEGWEPGTYAWVDYKEYTIWSGQPAPAPPPAAPRPVHESETCKTLTLADMRGLTELGTIRRLVVSFCAEVCPPARLTDAELQACIDRNK